ncbi:MAG TPA: PfkB family carbohydrate kinase [Phycisphaerae bacterium]
MPCIARKLVPLENLKQIVERERAAHRSIVQCHGCFDIVHPGHIRYLEFARRQGDLLIVSLTGDAEISKGAERPYIPQELRAENLAALEFVDYVYIDPHPTAETLLEIIRPDVYVKGREYEHSTDPGFLRERQKIESYGGRVIFSSGEIVFSSSQLIESLPRSAALDAGRLALLCRRHEIDRAALLDTLERCRGLRVIVIGDVVLDRYVFCDALDVASESPMLSLAKLEERSYIGGAAIVARHVAAMGAQAVLLSAVADDEASAQVRSVLQREAVEAHLLTCRPRLVEKTRYVVDDTKVLKVETADQVPLDSTTERQCARLLEEQAAAADAIIFCDFGYGMITAGLMQRVLEGLRRRVRIITADVSGTRGNLLHFRHADLLCPTERELRATLHDFEEGLSSVAWSLLAQTQARHLFVTLEKRGLVAFDRRGEDPRSPEWSARLRSEHLPSFADRVLDRLGCGDALLAIATLALAAGAPLIHAAYLGNAAAAIEIARLGNIPIDAAALRDWIKTRAEILPSDRRTVSPAAVAIP